MRRLILFVVVAPVAIAACSSSSSDDGATPPHDGGAPEPDVSAPPPDGATSCTSLPRIDPNEADRLSCAFHAGDRVSATIALTPEEHAKIAVKHVVVIMKENRSFDHMFGDLKRAQPDADSADSSFVNDDAQGASVAHAHASSTCVGFDPDHQWAAMHAQVNGGKMDGFVTSAATSTGGDGHFVMGYYDAADVPFYYFLASTYSIADRYFPSVRSGTFPNRDYLLLGTSDVVYSTQYVTWPNPSLATIFDSLTAAGVSWGVYADDHPLEECLDNPSKDWSKLEPWSPVSKLLSDFANDTLPSVVFVDGTENAQDEHPTADVQVGEAWTKKIYDAAIASKAWPTTALLLTYDEAGGFADHVPPPSDACLARAIDKDFFELGVRVPLIAISPWARRHFVSHVRKEHASITRFIETVFDLPALTARDANADALLDMFDFDCAPKDVPAAPAAGTKGCGGNASVTLDKTSFASGESIVVHFSGGPGNPKDWIGVYPRTDTPHAGSSLYDYCATDTHTATTQSVTSGTVTLDANSVNQATWPLAAGSSWTAYYLVNDGYDSIASVQFDIHN
jgi:phospholipase C